MTIVSNKGMREKRGYVCDTCGKAYKRSEHCIRHQRSHTNEKPFKCKFCHRRYARKDLVVRHEKTLHNPVTRPQPSVNDRSHSIASSVIEESLVTMAACEGPTDAHDETDANESVPNDSIAVVPSDRASSTTSATSCASLPVDQTSTYASTSDIPLYLEQTHDIHLIPFKFASPKHIALPLEGRGTASVNDVRSVDGRTSHFDFTEPFTSFPLDLMLLVEADCSPTSGDLLSLHSCIQDNSNPIHADMFGEGLTPPYTIQDEQRCTNALNRPSPNDTFRGLPSITKAPHCKSHCPQINDTHRTNLLYTVRTRCRDNGSHSCKFPTPSALSRYMRTFFDSFCVHLPFIHISTLD